MVARGFSQGEDPYQTLGVEAGASRDEIVRAYHRAALGSHQAGRSPGPPLWAGPVHVEPATAQPAGQDAQGIVHPADAYDLLKWWLRNISRRPR